MFATIITSLLAIASPAAATDTPAPAPTPKAVSGSYNPRVCVVSPPITGSRLSRRECKTLDQWRADGVDPLAGR